MDSMWILHIQNKPTCLPNTFDPWIHLPRNMMNSFSRGNFSQAFWSPRYIPSLDTPLIPPMFFPSMSWIFSTSQRPPGLPTMLAKFPSWCEIFIPHDIWECQAITGSKMRMKSRKRFPGSLANGFPPVFYLVKTPWFPCKCSHPTNPLNVWNECWSPLIAIDHH